MGVGLDRQGLVHHAAELVPMLRERAAETEVQRSLPQDIVDALHASELLLAVAPECFGGMGYDFEVAFDIAAELGRGCGSTAWCYGIWTSHTWLAGMFPEQAQKAYWADSPKNALVDVVQPRPWDGDGGDGRLPSDRTMGLF
ncbi:hypothetical protein C2W62_29375 [Candidatus Entotheonella serta]|nr:hypothetical protein C2W62_29375 [Candidatus Entotheonella serta]